MSTQRGPRSAVELLREMEAERDRRHADRNRVGLVAITSDTLARIIGLPAGYEVVNINASWAHQAVLLMVRSPDLAPVVPGSEAPQINGLGSIELYERTPASEDWDHEKEGSTPKTYVRFIWQPAPLGASNGEGQHVHTPDATSGKCPCGEQFG